MRSNSGLVQSDRQSFAVCRTGPSNTIRNQCVCTHQNDMARYIQNLVSSNGITGTFERTRLIRPITSVTKEHRSTPTTSAPPPNSLETMSQSNIRSLVQTSQPQAGSPPPPLSFQFVPYIVDSPTLKERGDEVTFLSVDPTGHDYESLRRSARKRRKTKNNSGQSQALRGIE